MLFNYPYRRHHHNSIIHTLYFDMIWMETVYRLLHIRIIAMLSLDWLLPRSQVPATLGSDFLFLAAHSHRANTATSKRGSCAGKFFFGPPWFQSGWPGSVGFVGIFHSIRQVFSWNITIGYNESGICWVQTDTKFGVLVQTLARIF